MARRASCCCGGIVEMLATGVRTDMLQRVDTNQGGWVTITSYAAMNRDAAYDRNRPYRLDQDGDCWPDLWDHAPDGPWYRDGVNN
jgi:hypothetical protein